MDILSAPESNFHVFNFVVKKFSIIFIALFFVYSRMHFISVVKTCNSPDCNTFWLQMIPAMIHFVKTTLQHNRIFLWRQRTEQFSSSAIKTIVNHTMSFNFRLQILHKTKQETKPKNVEKCGVKIRTRKILLNLNEITFLSFFHFPAKNETNNFRDIWHRNGICVIFLILWGH